MYDVLSIAIIELTWRESEDGPHCVSLSSRRKSFEMAHHTTVIEGVRSQATNQRMPEIPVSPVLPRGGHAHSFEGRARDVKGRGVETVVGERSPTHGERHRVIAGLTTDTAQEGEEFCKEL
jgi:hypothetical protein